MPGSLMEKTRTLLRDSPMTIPDIHADLKVAGITCISYFWLRKFSGGQVDDPSVNKVQILYEFLSGSTLTV